MLHEMAFIVWEENCMETAEILNSFKKAAIIKKGRAIT